MQHYHDVKVTHAISLKNGGTIVLKSEIKSLLGRCWRHVFDSDPKTYDMGDFWKIKSTDLCLSELYQAVPGEESTYLIPKADIIEAKVINENI